ncbi:protein translocase subunit SecD [Streptomyces sp. NPDC090052]|uniref:protein translocase subunit SecD n=1 Tax=unclassified Streptomyces TaxID=2593676 RepID=UPI0022506160|nr:MULTISPECIES: protein translocase subunit SecD [unclassified Streptomyces]MCX4727735.1 protein translocase subunit SecD [Streptomyces sp. NBC_01306]WSV03056.1 protein translocase subunit SecD [Streptomyces sp. NBC_01020]WSX41084.1 protein translocase subunit SecD [Streptomyces sp. NBC_00963]WSX70939.1 protein translocase subunit SecD [Streptomyces sp. NBC_00932]
MAAPNKGRRQTGAQGKPGRSLALILIAMVALVGGMFWAKQVTPRLGIDLAGGTSITLQAKPQPGKPNAINQKNMDTAVSIIERRVNGLGVSEAEVQTQGKDQILVNIPKGTNEKQARQQVGTTAQLYFRPVVTVAAGKPTPAGKPSTTPSPSASSKSKATDKSSSSSKKSTSSPQGRAVTDALKAGPTPNPSTPPQSSPTPSTADSAAAAKLEKKFAALDCSTKAGRAKAGGDNVKPSDPTVACSQSGDAKYILDAAAVDGTDVSGAKAVIDQQQGQWIVQMDFTSKGSKKFQAITSKLSKQQSPQNQFAIALDGAVVSAPSVSQTLSGSAQISGSFTQQSAEDLGNVLSYGALPLSFKEETVTTVTAALGGEQLQAGIIAGAIGLALVIIYLVAYYRGLSFIAILSLLVSAILTYSLMSLLGKGIGFALNLPAVCGAIVAIGITADSFIVYFERIRDEIREGRTLRPAVERAWPRARRTILVSDFVSFLAAAVLYIVTVGKVQGFAFTLGLTTLLDVVVVFLFTKPVMTLLARKKFFYSGHPWSGLDPKRLGAKPPLRRSRRAASSAPTDPKEA